MSDYSYTLIHPKFQALAYHLQRVSEQMEQMDIALYMARQAFKSLDKSFQILNDREYK